MQNDQDKEVLKAIPFPTVGQASVSWGEMNLQRAWLQGHRQPGNRQAIFDRFGKIQVDQTRRSHQPDRRSTLRISAIQTLHNQDGIL